MIVREFGIGISGGRGVIRGKGGKGKEREEIQEIV